MPIYEITAPDGNVFELEGDSEPTEKELESVFSSLQSQNPIEQPKQPKKQLFKTPSNTLARGFETGGSMPKIQTDITSKKGLKKLINTARVPAAFTPYSPLTEFVSETGTSLIDEKPIFDALKSGVKAAGVDLGLRLALGGLPAGSRKVLSPELANKLDQGLIAGVGKKLLPSSMSKRIRQEVVDEIVSKPTLLTKPNRTPDQLGEEVFNIVQKSQDDIGKLIGEAKTKAKIKKLQVNSDDFLNNLTRVESNKLKRDIAGNNAIEVISDEVKSLKSNEIEDMMKALKEIDNSREFQRIYSKQLDPTKTLSIGEGEAIRLRGQLSESIINSADGLFTDGKNLSDLNKQYTLLKRIQTQPNLKAAFKSKDATTRKLMQITREGNKEAYDALRSISDIAPETSGILDDAIKNSIKDEVDVIRSAKGGLFSGLIEFGTGTVPKTLLKSGNFSRESIAKPGFRSLATMTINDLQQQGGN